jgi:ABC-type amino acid transport substrate-binding protein
MTFSLTMVAKAEIPESLRLAAADWCPYTCPSEEQPGIVVEYLQHILTPYNIMLDVNYLPWSRALKEVDNGNISGLVTAVPSEAPHLLFTSTETMDYNVCLYSRTSSSLKYTGVSSLKNHALGAALDYSYDEEIDAYIKENKRSNHIELITGDKKVFRLTSMLLSKRIDYFIGDKYVIGWEAKNDGVDMSKVKTNQCLQSHPFYLALNPNILWSKELINILNKEFSKKNNLNTLSKIIARYTAQ